MKAKAKQSPAKASGRVAPGLELADFRLLEMTGLNESIRTSQAAIWFNDSLIVGTGRAPLGFMGRYTARQGAKSLRGEGKFGSMRADTGAKEEDGAQILRFLPKGGKWDVVYNSPLAKGRDGKDRARDRSIRTACVYQTRHDKAPALYLGVGSLERQVVFLRSEDGVRYEECAEQGFGLGDVDVPSVRCIVGLEGRLYSTPTGKNFDRGMFDDNLTDFPYIFEIDDALRGHWRPVCEPGFGDVNNLSVNELVAMDGCLYAATVNKRRGFQLWKTRPEGPAPYRWTKIFEDGAWRGPTASFPSVMTVFNGALYIGSTLQRQGRGGRDRYGPFAAEMLRVFPDDSWELVCGTPRFTPHGLKRPVSGMLGGFDNPFIHVLWRMAEYQGWLYLGGADWKWMPTYLKNRPDLSPAQLAHLEAETEKRRDGEFPMWRTCDGVNWELVTSIGFPGGNPNNYGIRELVSTPVGLFVLPTNKFSASGGGGLEVWWGRK